METMNSHQNRSIQKDISWRSDCQNCRRWNGWLGRQWHFVSDTEEEDILFYINDKDDKDETDDEEPCDNNNADSD